MASQLGLSTNHSSDTAALWIRGVYVWRKKDVNLS